MAKINDEELDIEIPGEDDENVGEGTPKKKKRKKSKEERIAERKVVFWSLLIILLITIGFWMMPKIKSFFKGESIPFEESKKNQVNPKQEKTESKNYVEITL